MANSPSQLAGNELRLVARFQPKGSGQPSFLWAFASHGYNEKSWVDGGGRQYQRKTFLAQRSLVRETTVTEEKPREAAAEENTMSAIW